MENNISKLDNDFINLAKENTLNISDVEDLLIKNIEEYKIQLHQHIEELLQQQVDENKIIVKKNKNGRITDIISVTKEKKN